MSTTTMAGDYVHLLHPVQVLKNHLRLMYGLMILGDTRTRFLEGDLYAERFIRVVVLYKGRNPHRRTQKTSSQPGFTASFQLVRLCGLRP